MKLSKQLFDLAQEVLFKREIEAQKKYLPQAEKLYNDIINECEVNAGKGKIAIFYSFLVFDGINEWIIDPQAIKIVEKKLHSQGFIIKYSNFFTEENPVLTMKQNWVISWDLSC